MQHLVHIFFAGINRTSESSSWAKFQLYLIILDASWRSLLWIENRGLVNFLQLDVLEFLLYLIMIYPQSTTSIAIKHSRFLLFLWESIRLGHFQAFNPRFGQLFAKFLLVHGSGWVYQSSSVGFHRTLEDGTTGDALALQTIGVHNFVSGKGINLFLDWIETAYRVWSIPFLLHMNLRFKFRTLN